jgi:hypothetical protein
MSGGRDVEEKRTYAVRSAFAPRGGRLYLSTVVGMYSRRCGVVDRCTKCIGFEPLSVRESDPQASAGWRSM